MIRADPPDRAVVKVLRWDEVTKVTIVEARTESSAPSGTNDTPSAAERAPYPIWQTGASGGVLWANAAYDALAPVDDTGYRPAVFDVPVSESFDILQPVRTSVHLPGQDEPLWFDVASVADNETLLHYAVDANAIVKAEVAQRNFVQTLTKTFAQLSIGLAIFDRNRQLALFNPALIDLTTLPADFLSAGPTLFSFFDRMRETQVMPEPKDYASWREQLAELVDAATDGRYSDTWTLPSGLTYRVTGRPHPDGAVAFLFEDISAEVSLTRRFRAELELGQSVLDRITQSISVFSSVGVLSLTNKTCKQLWGVETGYCFAELTLAESLDFWRERCEPTNLWTRIRDFANSYQNREPWETTVTRLDGTPLICRVAPLSGGAFMVVFAVVVEERTQREEREISAL
ncbi:PAS-domain containing protein [Salinihabitans flavidus]|uniref:PAS-domain containing protein n=1 Tax=Salinihabitans flavidus TaxID=569882 RepID=UPI0015876441|nr:PAS-domain containing protein [Salinihabitans flavidus]